MIPGLFGWKKVVPYLFGGIQHTNVVENNEITTPGWSYVATGTPFLEIEYDTFSPFLGLGLIIPINESIGIRADVAPYWNSSKVDYLNANIDDKTYTGWTYMGHLTGYVNITSSVNIQVGAKSGRIQLGGSSDAYWGCYTMLGISF